MLGYTTYFFMILKQFYYLIISSYLGTYLKKCRKATFIFQEEGIADKCIHYPTYIVKRFSSQC